MTEYDTISFKLIYELISDFTSQNDANEKFFWTFLFFDTGNDNMVYTAPLITTKCHTNYISFGITYIESFERYEILNVQDDDAMH